MKLPISHKIGLMKETEGKCIYCGNTLNPASLTMDHIIAKINGGSNHDDNLICSCENCNREKGQKSVREFMAGRDCGRVAGYIERIERLHANGFLCNEKYMRLAGRKEEEDNPDDIVRTFTWTPFRWFGISFKISYPPRRKSASA